MVPLLIVDSLGMNHFKILPAIRPDIDGDRYEVKLCYSQVLCWMLHYGAWATHIKSLEFELEDSAHVIGYET